MKQEATKDNPIRLPRNPDSGLKTYKVKKTSGGALKVTCPESKCGLTFIIPAEHAEQWLDGHLRQHSDGKWWLYETASCPHCYRTAWRT